MYTNKDLSDISAQRKRRWIVLMIPVTLLLAVVVVSVVIRMQWLTIVSSILFGGVFLFGYDMFVKPLSCYKVHLQDALQGIVHDVDLTFDSIDDEVSVVDGVRYRAVNCTYPMEDGKTGERMFYWDMEKPLPNVTKGDQVRITYHDRAICDFAVL